MTRERIKPTRTTNDAPGFKHDRYREDHPAYGMIGASRVSSHPGTHLAGSDFAHQNYVVVAIRTAALNRDTLSSDYWFAEQDIVHVALSEAQWASFVSTMNVGHGVPCSIEYTREDGYLPGIQPIDNRREQFNDEVAEDLSETVALLRDLIPTAKNRAQREQMERALKLLTDSLPFTARQFDKHAEKTIERAKSEVDAFLTQAIHRAGLQALGGAASPIEMLGAGNDGDDDGA